MLYPPVRRICIIFLNLIVSIPIIRAFTLNYDSSCARPLGTRPDARPILDQAFNMAAFVADVASDHLNYAYETADFASLSYKEFYDIYRIDTILTAWFSSPWKSSTGASVGPFSSLTPGQVIVNLQRTKDGPGYIETTEALLAALNTIADTDPMTMPKIYCGEDMTKFQRYDRSPSGRTFPPPGWAYVDRMVKGDPQWLPPGVVPCGDDGAEYFIPVRTDGSKPYMIWCSWLFENDWATDFYADTFPKNTKQLAIDRSDLLPPQNQIEYYIQTNVGYMMKALHNLYIANSRVESIEPVTIGSGTWKTANGYTGIVALAIEVVANDGPWDRLTRNVDSFTFFAIAAAFVGNEWSTWQARFLTF